MCKYFSELIKKYVIGIILSVLLFFYMNSAFYSPYSAYNIYITIINILHHKHLFSFRFLYFLTQTSGNVETEKFFLISLNSTG